MLTPPVGCDARVLINGEVLATAVSVRSDEDGTLYLDAGARRSFLLRSFVPNLMSCLPSIEARIDGANQCFETGMGSWSWGPLGHPGDGEFESRPVRPLVAHAIASPGKIVIALEGHSEPGRALYKGVPDPEHRDPLPPWHFTVEFSLSQAAVRTLSGINGAQQ